jgi:Flp pilus assembly protein TadD
MKTIFNFLMIAAVCTLMSGCKGSQKSVTGEKINDKQLTSQSDKQKQTYIRQIDNKYSNAKAHYELGKIYHKEGNWDKAEWEYNKALAFDPVHHEAQASIVKLLSDKGDKQRCDVIAEQYINQAGISAKNSLLLGRAFQDRGLDDYALTCYTQAHRLAPNSVVINKQLGYFYLLKNDNANAEIYLRRAFELDPYQPEVAGQLGKLGVQVEIPRKARDMKRLDKKKEVSGASAVDQELK